MSTPIREINPESPPQPLDDAVKAEIVALLEYVFPDALFILLHPTVALK